MFTKSYLKVVLHCSVVFLSSVRAQAQVNVLTSRYDNARTGSNLQEAGLSTLNVNANQFGRLYAYPVDGAIYAQPLYISGLSIAGGKHNVVYVATMNDKVYAFDGDKLGAPLWMRDFTNSSKGITPVPITDLVNSNLLNIVGNVGVESTPVIDLAAGTMYLVVRTKESGSYVQRLHALDVTTGADRSGSPSTISAAVSSSAPDAVEGQLFFDPKMENQRASLALTNGTVLISWGSHEDDGAFHGWIMSYDASTLRQVGVFCTTPNGTDGGIWQSGRAPVIDPSGYAYFQTGNGDWDGQNNFGDSVLKLRVSNHGLTLADWFTPDDQSSLSSGDVDLGSTGVMLIPGSSVILGGGKESIFYLLQSGNLGHLALGNGQIIQSVPIYGGEMKGGPAFWNSPKGPLVYSWAQTDVLRAFHFNGTTLDSGTFAAGTIYSPGSPGGTLTVSANGSASGTGIVWAELSTSQDSDHGTVPGVMRAFNAETMQELWNSELIATRDRLGTLVKYVPPIVANGKVYAATYDNVLAVYGLLNGATPMPYFNLEVGTGRAAVQVGGIVKVPVSVAGMNGFTGTVGLSVADLPGGATASFSAASVSGSGESNLQIATAGSTPAGSYLLTVTGTSGAEVHTATVQLTVSSTVQFPVGAISIDFVGQGTPMQLGEVAGVIAKANWNSASGAVSSGPLALADENGMATGASVSWTSNNVWKTTVSDVAGNYRMMRGYLDTSQTNATLVSVTGLAPKAGGYDVYVYIDGDNPSATRTGTYQISGAGNSPSTLVATDAASTDFAGAFFSADGTAGNYLKFSVQSTGFTLTATPGTAVGSSFVRAPVNAIQIVPSSLPDFSIVAGTGMASIGVGGAVSTPVSIVSQNDFTGAVELSVAGLPAGASASFSSVAVSGAATSNLQIATSPATAPGTYSLTITGMSGTLLHTTSLSLTVFTNALPQTAAISIDFVGLGTPMLPGEVAGLIPKAKWNDAWGSASLQPLALADENGSATGASVTWSSDNIWSTKIGDTPGNMRMMNGYLDTSNANASTVTVTGLAGSVAGYDVYVYIDGDNRGTTRTGTYQITGPGISATTTLATDAAGTNFAGTFIPANGTAGNYLRFSVQSTAFTLTAIPGFTTDGYARAPINALQIIPSSGVTPPSVPDFSVGTGLGGAAVQAGGTVQVPVNVASLNGFNGTVGLSVAGLPSGASGSFSAASVSASGSSTLQIATVATTPAGSYALTITGTSGAEVHNTTVQLTVSTAVQASATVISVDFVGQGTPMQPTEVAGVVAKPNWNSAAGAISSRPLALVDENGTATSASISWTSDNTWSTKLADMTGNFRMMNGYLDNGRTNATLVTVSGLSASSGGYDVYVYTDGDNGVVIRTGTYQISGLGVSPSTLIATDGANVNFAGTFFSANGAAGNYLKFRVQGAGFTLTATPGTSTGDSFIRAPVNAIQIVPTTSGM